MPERGAMARLSCRILIPAAALVLGLVQAHGARADELRARLSALAAEHGFAIKGLEKVGPTAVMDTQGGLRARLQALLVDYNHILEGKPPAIARIIILGEKSSSAAAVEVNTTRRGVQHMVQATLEGPGGEQHTLSLMVDTGASSVVLPSSMIEALGFDAGDLEERESRTANGVVKAKSAQLQGVRLGDAIARDVEVLFISDAALGETRLLGMSFFERFAMTIDHEGNRLLLKPQ